MSAAHEPLDRINGALRVGDGLSSGGFADEHVALIGERDDARREPIAFGVRNDLRFFTFHHGDDRVGRTQVDTDNFFPSSHGLCSLKSPRIADVSLVCLSLNLS